MRYNSDNEWEKFGQTDPYFGVMTDEKFRTHNLTEQIKEEFFASGAEHIEAVIETVRQQIDPDFTVKRALDFGCGVGRLVIPLSHIAKEVTGVDVSQAMLEEAVHNCNTRGLNNIILTQSDDTLSCLQGKYNFIHSYTVFQHIPVSRGETIFQGLLERLEAGGVGVLHFTYYTSRPKKLTAWIKRRAPFSIYLFNLLKKRNLFAPQMEMNAYDLNRLFAMIQRENIDLLYAGFTDHGGILGIIIYFKRMAKAD